MGKLLVTLFAFVPAP